MTAATLHPPIIDPRIVKDDSVDGGYVMNFAAVIAMAKEGETKRSRLLYMTYCQEYRALESQGLTHKVREDRALRSACAKMGMPIVDAKKH